MTNKHYNITISAHCVEWSTTEHKHETTHSKLHCYLHNVLGRWYYSLICKSVSVVLITQGMFGWYDYIYSLTVLEEDTACGPSIWKVQFNFNCGVPDGKAWTCGQGSAPSDLHGHPTSHCRRPPVADWMGPSNTQEGPHSTQGRSINPCGCRPRSTVYRRRLL